jgi:threonine aldolase
MDSNWWLLRGLLSRRVMRLGGGLVGMAVLYVMFFGALENWTKQTIQDRATTVAEWRAERVREAFDLPTPSPAGTSMFSIPSRDARVAGRQLRAAGYEVSLQSRQGQRWRIVVRDLQAHDVADVEVLVREVSPRARRLP